MNPGGKSGGPSLAGQLLVFLVAGVALRFWIFHPHEQLNLVFILCAPLGIVLLIIPALNRRIDAALGWLNRACASHPAVAAVIVGVGAGADLLLEAWRCAEHCF